ncbi:putative mitochondrial Glycine cleavage system H protein [Leptomonas pyrrhocoris]|uniref:Glycine cleavage system H protein n=1 Tax=Leptomonas pyrrhocoris TaxID=157538 RepID=A0A0M9GB98_LEPPY|nr:putative mitochondrial Glycine cleavage system H protein [Leptomonas pyrrhocoris]XP_015665025.1 putative mitochondrial Glycine cleavage system H protein [Leptomonas pyrrhocoris]XP_015665026.1 putative mitochondrial Glycine cleavage system H protein [Leptomonas pyrrhocoris]KPA86585.1 putative mitochondrial Glycine cleavage system H protein [Leptomonas pyrrhocoris]KPA86586.1 putative mitochondrial Glycine cleavage system H protein [Leptomonas pyrrhocoris]KPA86587.1 putative mitochondrial Glyc|eukprot:XP_015665024.1 putative mitochondrial Glycine cleavage system H protein [Leptomonas pyrrhocoris]
MRRALTSVSVAAVASLRCYATKHYTDSHEWVEQADGEVIIGISTYAQENLGDVVYVSLPQVGDKVSAKDVVGEVESVKATSNVYSPVDGTVSAVNEKLKDEPGLINQSAEEKGWLVKVKCSEIPKGLMDAEEYKKFLE